MIDFTLNIYHELLTQLRSQNYNFQTFEHYLENPLEKTVILRHDVDKLPVNALYMAQLENDLGISASYYFRIVKSSNSPDIIKQIVELNHEIGYHYEDITINKGDISKSIEHFEKCLNYFRTYYNVKTICMHGSPASKWDNRLLWDTIDYKKYGIIGEPYFDIDYNKVFYLTDTGRKWNNFNISVRDKVNQYFNYKINKTQDIIQHSRQNDLPNQLMINCHPQRWSNSIINWVFEIVAQSIKNPIKRILVSK